MNLLELVLVECLNTTEITQIDYTFIVIKRD